MGDIALGREKKNKNETYEPGDESWEQVYGANRVSTDFQEKTKKPLFGGKTLETFDEGPELEEGWHIYPNSEYGRKLAEYVKKENPNAILVKSDYGANAYQ